jgi:hypothetical protein
MKIYQDILDLLHAYRRKSSVNSPDYVTRDNNVIMRAPTILGNGVIIVSPYDPAHLSRWYYQLYDIKKSTLD